MIRMMKASDLAQCGMIYAKAFPMEHWGIDWTAENAAHYLQDYFEQKRFVGYVYEDNEEVLGCIFALCKSSGSKKEIYINEMAVLPERQGLGIGKQLLDAVKDYSKTTDLQELRFIQVRMPRQPSFMKRMGSSCQTGLYVCTVSD